ncbi:MAG: (p)ppGpp synthetase [Clostridia bacterium]|nr:(p)ppGpp synthetase [Clostridia bacterium]
MDKLVELYNGEKFKIEQFMKRLVNFFQDNPSLHDGPLPVVHSVKYRMKDNTHLEDKLRRKISEGRDISKDNFFDEVTDLAGIRVLHLYSRQIEEIHNAIIQEVKSGDLALFEEPKAYTWDIDSQSFYESLGLKTLVKPSYYTSVHYVLMPKEGSPIKCEVQVRTLYEEVWGEIDHSINYPYNCESKACIEQLKVLAQLTAAGTRLANSIITSKNEHDEMKNTHIEEC